MKRNSEFHDFIVHDLMGHIPGITSCAMFGGYGVYLDGVIFALVLNGVLYFKVDGVNQSQYEKYGSTPFVYKAKGKKVTLSYFTLPEEIMENPDLLSIWIEDAVDASLLAKKPKCK
ncbi:MAG: hypothetical protein A2845_01500 [Candidatus Lloydbacteria bacterium RIFCSPHIGHO2_01_FULL_49_22]|uniref:TfoX N-terminal domain-containing protein n=1 Tax=Candidatus Lloydbacteria bacterium RIFCSPHIGHO2_01_FULL_49_22 TaxID=1798658 RepID=A0A1G2CXY4_9BACT|nr:MAG: hypothetical protein A2845_01500 [Candidatus Lloydbacteria bacterium RIFCSPHIGHO2_01_FULL_49_22]OGZ09973.1 MAG: hypothetical protein A3C14_04665 [Candidatus Lloydbacteria bacterium RIFCSPHIGHO2_02_FULL_50_18]